MNRTRSISLLLLFFSAIAFAQAKFVAQPDSKELKDEVFIVTELSETNPTISDSIVVKYKLYVSYNTGIENWRETAKPKYSGFVAKYIESDGMKIIKEKYNDEAYRMVTLKEVVLRPNRKGEFLLPNYILDVGTSTPSKTEKDSYGRYKLEKQSITIVTDEIKLTVK